MKTLDQIFLGDKVPECLIKWKLEEHQEFYKTNKLAIWIYKQSKEQKTNKEKLAIGDRVGYWVDALRQIDEDEAKTLLNTILQADRFDCGGKLSAEQIHNEIQKHFPETNKNG